MASQPSSPASDDQPKLGSTELDLYRLAVEMADRASARRGTASNFFLAVHAAIITAVAALAPDYLDVSSPPVDSTIIAVAGIAHSATWWLSLRSYRHLHRVAARNVASG
jgi:hypothetical protein